MPGLQRGLYQRPAVNSIIPPAAAGPLGGLVTQLSGLGHFDLTEEDALILSVDTLSAPYVGFQLGDPWTVSYEYRDRFSSRNNAQAEFGPGGRMTLVVALKDPGFVNWVEPHGGHSGSMTFRGQQFPPVPNPVQIRCV